MLQTRVQHVLSAQLGLGWPWKQLPASGSPQASQMSLASAAQLASQPTWQQYAKSGLAQTVLQHPGSSHPGVVCATKQLPGTGKDV